MYARKQQSVEKLTPSSVIMHKQLAYYLLRHKSRRNKMKKEASIVPFHSMHTPGRENIQIGSQSS